MVKRRIELAMAFRKSDAEDMVNQQSDDLCLHSLKFLAHVESVNGEYNYWQKDIATTLKVVAKAATSVKKSKTLKRSWVVESLLAPWQSAMMPKLVTEIYRDDYHLTKRFKTAKEMTVSLKDLEPLRNSLVKLVDALYQDDDKTFLEIAESFFQDLARHYAR